MLGSMGAADAAVAVLDAIEFDLASGRPGDGGDDTGDAGHGRPDHAGRPDEPGPPDHADVPKGVPPR